MKRYIVPSAEFIHMGNSDILTASVGIDLSPVDMNTSNFNIQNAKLFTDSASFSSKDVPESDIGVEGSASN